MKPGDWKRLQEGDVVRDRWGQGWLVQGNYGSAGIVLARIQLAMNPREWELVYKAAYELATEDV